MYRVLLVLLSLCLLMSRVFAGADTFTTLIHQICQQNPGVQTSLIQLKQAAASVRQAQAQTYEPGLSGQLQQVNGTGAHQTSNQIGFTLPLDTGGRFLLSNTTGYNPDVTRWSNSNTLRFEQPLFGQFGSSQTNYGIQMARIAERLAAENVQKAVQSAIIAGTAALTSVLQARAELTASTIDIQLYTWLLEQTDKRITLGMATDLDRNEAALQLAAAEDALLTAQINLETAANTVAQLAGKDFELPSLTRVVIPDLPKTLPVKPLFEQNIDVKIAELAITRAQLARGNTEPHSALTGSAFGAISTVKSDTVFGNTWQLSDPSLSFGLSWQFSPFDGANHSSKDMAAWSERAAILQREALLDQLTTHYQSAASTYQMLARQITTKQAIQNQAEKQLALQKQKLQLGIVAYNDIINTQRTLTQARNGVVRAQCHTLTQWLAVEALLGHTLSDFHLTWTMIQNWIKE